MTMPELLTAMAILAFVMSGILGVFVGGLHATTNMDEQFQAQQNARLALTSMRKDIRTACQESVAADAMSVKLTYCDGTTNPVTWCVSSSSGTAPFGLYRLSGSGTCGWATGVKRADQLRTTDRSGQPVTIFTAVVVSGSLPQLQVTLPVDASAATSKGLYTLADTITLRNLATPTVATAVSNSSGGPVASAPIGSTVHDVATVSASQGTPTGTVVFTLYSGNTTCSGTGTDSSPVTLSSGTASSGSATVPAGGLSYIAHYSGDSTYKAAPGPCEPLAVQ